MYPEEPGLGLKAITFLLSKNRRGLCLGGCSLKFAFIVLMFLLGCQTPGSDMEIATTPFSHEDEAQGSFGAPSFYAKWKNTPVVFFVGSDNAELYSAAEQSVAEINRAVGFPLLILKGLRSIEDGAEEYKGWNRINTIVEVTDGEYMDIAERAPKSLAITKLITSKSQLYEADILIRRSTIESRFLKATILHELGHAIGLGHTKDKRSFMFPELRDPQRFVLGQQDAAVLFDRYSSSN